MIIYHDGEVTEANVTIYEPFPEPDKQQQESEEQ